MGVIKIWCISMLMLIALVPLSRNASLSSFEQKKYKNFIEGQGLFTSDDDIEILTFHNFKAEVMGAPHAFLVEFYNSWCGFCQRFAPSWKALGTDIKGWNDLVRVAALDCSDDDNFPICREYEIMAYPTLRYFHENYQMGPKNLGVDVTKGEDMQGHRRQLIERMVTEQTEGRGKMYPNLLPYADSNVSHLFNSTPSSVQYEFLVVDAPGSFLGAEVALDLHRVRSIAVRYAPSNNTNLLDSLRIDKLPAVVAVDRSQNFQVFSDKVGSREVVKSTIRSYLRSKNIDVGNDVPKNKDIYTGKWLDSEVPDMATLMQERARQALKERVKKMGDVVFQMDLETALRYSIKHEVSSVKVLQGEKLQALRAYLDVLKKYFPFGHGGQVFLNELTVAVAADQVQGEKLAEIIRRAEQEGSQVFSSPPQWLACKGSTSSHRGYPCGLWKLFHYLTVNAAEQNVHNQNANPLEVLAAMHGYIKNFFGCADCSQHFQEMALKKDMWNVSSPDSAVLWLWMAHNQANKRLAGDQTEDPEYPKYQFPSKERCPQCKNSDNTWNLAQVLNYLKHMYSSINVRYIGSDTRVLHVGLEGDSTSGGSSSMFRAVDATRV